ncbi:MAG: thiol peroxidase [Nitrospirae bacterium]|nr:MAG: thiol peroxidase [Nitrospirota bacterium]
MSTERPAAATLKGNPLTLVGPELKVGDKAPDFTARKGLEDVSGSRYNGQVRVLLSVPSLDTPVCDQETRRFNEAAASLGDVKVVCISMDLPFAQGRFCETAGIDRVETLSDYKDASFGTAYGVLIKEHRLDHRAVFVVDRDDTIRHVEYVPEMTDHPNYDAALAAVKALL